MATNAQTCSRWTAGESGGQPCPGCTAFAEGSTSNVETPQGATRCTGGACDYSNGSVSPTNPQTSDGPNAQGLEEASSSIDSPPSSPAQSSVFSSVVAYSAYSDFDAEESWAPPAGTTAMFDAFGIEIWLNQQPLSPTNSLASEVSWTEDDE